MSTARNSYEKKAAIPKAIAAVRRIKPNMQGKFRNKGGAAQESTEKVKKILRNLLLNPALWLSNQAAQRI